MITDLNVSQGQPRICCPAPASFSQFWLTLAVQDTATMSGKGAKGLSGKVSTCVTCSLSSHSVDLYQFWPAGRVPRLCYT